MTSSGPDQGTPIRTPVGAPVTHAHRREPVAWPEASNLSPAAALRRWRFTSAVEAARHLGTGGRLQPGSG